MDEELLNRVLSYLAKQKPSKERDRLIRDVTDAQLAKKPVTEEEIGGSCCHHGSGYCCYRG